MNKKTKNIVITSLFIGAILFFGYKSFAKPNKPSGGSGGNDFKKFKVNTSSDDLNVRSGASTSSPIITSLPKGNVIFARPSSVAGWSEYSEDGKTVKGYVSTNYLVQA